MHKNNSHDMWLEGISAAQRFVAKYGKLNIELLRIEGDGFSLCT